MDKKSLKINTQNLSEENFIKWEKVQENLKENFGSQIYSSWLKNIKLLKEYNHYVILGVQTRFFRDWITSRYADKILDEIKKHKMSIDRIAFEIQEDKSDNKAIFSKTLDSNISDIKDSVLNYNRLNPNLNFDNFVLGESNKLAYVSAQKICTQLSRYNPLFIYGGVGLGKTHLINSIGLKLQENNNVMFISAERFMYQFIKSIKKK